MTPSKTQKLSQELREKVRIERDYQVEDSKRLLKQAIFAHGGERLREEIELAQERRDEQQQLEDEQRAFNEMLERNNEDEDTAGG